MQRRIQNAQRNVRAYVTLYWLFIAPSFGTAPASIRTFLVGPAAKLALSSTRRSNARSDAPVVDPGKINGKLARQSVFLHCQRNDHTFSDPFTRNGATKLCGDGPIDQLAAKPALAGRCFNRWPPLSVHTRTTSVGWGAQDTSRVPASEESAPYFSELVASS